MQDCGLKSIDKPEIIIENGLMQILPDIVLCKNFVIICDFCTLNLIPNNIKNLKNIKIYKVKNALPYQSSAIALLHLAIKCELIIAVGSGSVTDVAKYAAYLANIKWISCPTAPSVNAYTSANASLIFKDKKKHSVKAKMPHAVYVDLDVISSAPKRLILSGLYDLICSQTVNPDLFLSHIVKNTYYNQQIFQSTINQEEELTKYVLHLLKKDKTLCKMLINCLLLSGLWMTKCKSSASASQAEHIIAHIIEAGCKNRFFHGECVAISMTLVAEIQKNLFWQKKIKISHSKFLRYAKIKSCSNFCANKIRLIEKTISDNLERLHYLTKNHHKLKNFIKKSQITLPSIKDTTQFNKAFLTRDRFTCLDLQFLSCS